MAGVQGALFVPGSHKVALPRTRNGIAVFSMGSLIPESEALEFESAAHGESHTWRATREFALLGEILGSFEWGALDLLMFDLPPGAERTVQYADFLGPRTSFLLVTIPSEVARGVVARSVAALSKGPNRLLGYVENMSGYYCRDCNAIKPLFVSSARPPSGTARNGHRAWRSPASGPSHSIPSWHGTAIGGSPRGTARNTRWPGPGAVAQQLLDSLESLLSRATATASLSSAARSLPMKFLCVPCDSPMKLQTVGPPERGSLSVVYSCPECGYEMAMLTNPFETQVVQSLGVRIGPDVRLRTLRAPRRRRRAHRSGGRCPFTAMMPATEGQRGRGATRPGRRADAGPVDFRRRSAAREHSRVRPPHGADRHREIRPGERGARSGREDPRRGPRLLRHVSRSRATSHRAEHAARRAPARSPGPTSSPGTSPTAATSPASTAISTPAARLWSARRTSPIGASSAPRNASGSSTKSPPSRLNA